MTSQPTQYQRAEQLADRMIKAVGQGVSVSELARTHGLRREAISAVLTEHGIGQPSAAREAVLAYIRSHPNLSVDDLALRLDLSKSSVSRYIRGSDEARLVVSRKHTDRSTFTDAQMGQALRSVWKKLDDKSKGLSRIRYNRERAEGTPAASTFIRRWGSWSAACEAAGITASKPRRDSYEQTFTDDDVLRSVNEFIDETGSTVYHRYAEWAREHGRPSGPLLVMRWGGWANARKEANKLRKQAA
jgi:DNA-binding transcriptional ArsR family regulator